MASEVLATVRVTGKQEWTGTDMTSDEFGAAILLQSDDANIGIIGSCESLCDMLDSMADALATENRRTA